jgi:hypothetical protein
VSSETNGTRGVRSPHSKEDDTVIDRLIRALIARVRERADDIKGRPLEQQQAMIRSMVARVWPTIEELRGIDLEDEHVLLLVDATVAQAFYARALIEEHAATQAAATASGHR